MSKYKALLIDLDDTLIMSYKLYRESLRFASSILASKYSLNLDEFFAAVQEKHLIVSRNFPTVHTRHSRVLVFRMALDEIVGKYDLSMLPDVEDAYWEYFLKNIKPFPEVPETLYKIRSAGIKIGVVSDGGLSLRIRKLKAANLLSYVDEVIVSEEVIFEKPFSAIFTLAMTKLKAESYNSLMVGNNYKNDIRGAQLLGIRSGIFDPHEAGNVEGQDGTIVADFVMKQFSDLLKEVDL